MSDKTVKLERRRKYPFTVNCPVTKKKFRWSGAKGNKTSIIPVPEDTYEFLVMDTTTFADGELVIVEEADKEDFDLGIDEDTKEEIENNTHNRKEIVEILEDNTNSMKATLRKVTNKSEKLFIVSVAKELKLDSAAKRNFLSEWFGSEIDFGDDEEE